MKGVDYFNVFGQNISRADAGISLIENREPSKNQSIQFNFDMVEGCDFNDAYRKRFPEDSEGFPYDGGLLVLMGTTKHFTDEDGNPMDDTPAFYSDNRMFLNPTYFDPKGKMYSQKLSELNINVLTHEIGHDLKLNHNDPITGKPSNELDAYPSIGIMSNQSGFLHTPTQNELQEIESKTPEIN